MYLCYIDESGNTGDNLNDIHQPYLVLTTLIIPPQYVKQVESAMRELGYRYFGAESRNTDFEFHGDAIYNARKRDRYFHKLQQDKKFEIFDKLVDIVVSNEFIKIGYIAINKMKYYGKLHVQQCAFQLMIEKIEEKMQRDLDSHYLLIADEQDELEQKLIDDLDHFKQHGTTWGYKTIAVEKAIDSVHFVKSHNNYCMQLTDVMCYLIRKGIEAEYKLDVKWFSLLQEERNVFSTYIDWLETADLHKGHKYFYKIYKKLNKPWLFSKIFPL